MLGRQAQMPRSMDLQRATATSAYSRLHPGAGCDRPFRSLNGAMLSPPELGKAETISAIDSATNMVMNTTATQPQTTLTGPAKECHGLFSKKG